MFSSTGSTGQSPESRLSEAVRRVKAGSLRPSGSKTKADVVAMDMGEPHFDTPPVIVQAAVDALHAGRTHYGDLNGDPELRELIAAQASVLSGRAINPNSVLVSHGGAAAITSTMLALVDAGDRVLIPEPTYSLYADAVRLAGGEVVFIPTAADHHLDIEAIKAAAEGAAMIVLCNPVNPTGIVFTADELTRMAGVLGPDTHIVIDEAYAHLIYDGVEFTPALAIPALADRLIYIQTLSKTYAMTGWRIGYVIAPDDLAEGIKLVHRTINSSMNAFVQRAAITALTSGPEPVRPMGEHYTRCRQYVMDRISRFPGAHAETPDGGFYVFLRYPGNQPSNEVVTRLREAGVAVRAGSEYGPHGEGHIRLSFAGDLPQLEQGLDVLEKVIHQLGEEAAWQKKRLPGIMSRTTSPCEPA